MISWDEYLLLCTGGVILAGSVIGWKRVIDIRNYSAAFLLVMYTTYVIRPYAAYTFDKGLITLEPYLPGMSYMAERDNGILALIFCAALFFFALGYRFAYWRYSRVARITHPAGELSSRALILYSHFSLLIILAGYSSFFLARRGFLGFGGGPIKYIQTDSGTILGNTTGYLELANYLVITGLLLYYASTRKLHWALLFAAPWIINQIYFGWARFMLIVLGLGLLGVWLAHGYERRVSLRQGLLVLSIAVLSITLLILMRSNREFLRQGESFDVLVEGLQTSSVDNALGDFSGFEGTWFVVSTMGNRRPLFGSSMVYNILIKPIPRLLWRGKPLLREFTWYDLFQDQSYQSYLYTTLGVSEDLWYKGPVRGSIGYALEEWGWAGIAMTFIITGLFLGWIQSRVSRANWNNPAWIAAYAATYGMIGMLGRNDLFYLLTHHILLFYLPYFLINVWVKQQIGFEATENHHPSVPALEKKLKNIQR